ncbi:MAG: AmmeMemoRadiSam system protein B [Treponema sp.]|nr:AmmeMemoRadiSam system protein B [Treponema sp.]
MDIRRSCLPSPWYPRGGEAVSRFLSPFAFPSNGKALAAVAPHAGWYYSGRFAAQAVAALERDASTVIVAGGHLPAGMSPLFALEDQVAGPLGNIPIDAGLRDALYEELNGREDRYQDNTVEVLLPMVRYFFPEASLLWIRLPAEISSFETGKTIARTARSLKRKTVLLGSTDLTHYGPNYSFSPRGYGRKALEWMEKENDRAFIDAVLSGNPEETLRRAEEDRSACSAGAVLGAMGFASFCTGSEKSEAELLAYGTSAAVSADEIPDSFVGYGAFCFS